ncbi:MAG: hypothetical protein JSV13_05575 [Nitrospiraceae bacterium]|nr:MAG: hypothetical protein JSV13_05575 [Nitrospiraceae bacterium]
MGLTEAKKYIQHLHKKQDNPYLWPDYLTGLPDKSAIIKKMESVYPKLGSHSIAYVRIANIHPYLIKYGPDRHAEIIQWAAAILHTTSKKCKDSFVGTLSTHDFIITCRTKNVMQIVNEARRIFNRKIESFYTKKDLKKRTTLTFKKDGGEKVDIGLVTLISVIADSELPTKRSHLIQDMGRICQRIEGTGEDIIVMTDDMIF